MQLAAALPRRVTAPRAAPSGRIELAVARSALLGDPLLRAQPRNLRRSPSAARPRLQLFFVRHWRTRVRFVLGDGRRGEAIGATLITTEVAVSVIPILIRIVPPLARAARTRLAFGHEWRLGSRLAAGIMRPGSRPVMLRYADAARSCPPPSFCTLTSRSSARRASSASSSSE